MFKNWIAILFTILVTKNLQGQTIFSSANPEYLKSIRSVSGLVALWDFKEKTGSSRKAYGMGTFPLKEVNGKIERINDGPVSGYSALFKTGSFLRLLNNRTGKLNIHGKNQAITVMAWIKWDGNTGFVGGMWNEYEEGGKRQYGLFVSLPHYNGDQQVCGHISKTGKASPPFPYSIDYSASRQVVKKGEWQCVAFTYDGQNIRSYLDGIFEPRGPELINNTQGFEGYPNGLTQSKNPYYYSDGIGNNGSDFTVGAVLLKSGMGNFFKGQIGGLAVFKRALIESEIIQLATLHHK